MVPDPARGADIMAKEQLTHTKGIGNSSECDLRLDPEMPAVEAIKAIHRNLLKTIRAHEEGTLLDLDSEFLHDFRVSVRRTRSALTQIKQIYPEEVVSHFRREFSWLGTVTGPTRDFDVFLLKMNEYRAELPEAMQPDLDPLVAYLHTRQQFERQQMVQVLASERYRQLIRDWSGFLDETDILESELSLSRRSQLSAEERYWCEYSTKLMRSRYSSARYDLTNTRRPIIDVVSERIWRVYRRIYKQGIKITHDSSADALHRMRIECKKLRYLLEFFHSLYKRSDINPLIKALKRLQDNLGDFNDYEVQQYTLKDIARQMQEGNPAPASTFLAIERLIEKLEQGQSSERKYFHKCFSRFSKRDNRKRFRRLFKK